MDEHRKKERKHEFRLDKKKTVQGVFATLTYSENNGASWCGKHKKESPDIAIVAVHTHYNDSSAICFASVKRKL